MPGAVSTGPAARARLAAYYPLFRRWLVGQQAREPALACEVEDAAWAAFFAACADWDPARCPRFATYLLLRLRWGRYPWRRRLRSGRLARAWSIGDAEWGRLPDRRPAPDPEGGPALHAALGRLPGRERDVLALRYGEDLSLSAAGARLGLSRWAIRRDERRALGRLRELLAAG